MQLEFSGAPEIDAGVGHVWRRLLDADFVARCAPGVQRVEQLTPTEFKVLAGIAVGSLELVFAVDVALSNLVAERYAEMSVGGTAPGSDVRVTSSVTLTPVTDHRTLLEWMAKPVLRGTVVNIGARLLKGTAAKLADEFWRRFVDGVEQSAPPRVT
jgi:carbon monoxide dehydrogenase subunit G